jgi:hypothetical protein
LVEIYLLKEMVKAAEKKECDRECFCHVREHIYYREQSVDRHVNVKNGSHESSKGSG